MDLKNCAECGKIFVHPTRDVCDACHQKEEDDFKKVKEYLWKKIKSNVEEVHEATEVPLKRIHKFIREGRLNTGGLAPLYLECETCGAPITEGRFCEACRGKMVRDFGIDAPPANAPKTVPNDETARRSKMFTADRINKK